MLDFLMYAIAIVITMAMVIILCWVVKPLVVELKELRQQIK